MTHARRFLGRIAPLAIVAAAVAGFLAMGSQAPPPRRGNDTAAAMSVRTAIVTAGDSRIEIDLDGVVVPLREVTLAAEVTGRVIGKSDGCRAGRFVRTGDVLLEIDPRDYELDVQRLQREVAQAELYIQEVEEELQQNEESIDLADRQVALASREVQRLESLQASRVVTESELDRAVREELNAINTVTQLKGQQRVLEKRKSRLAEGRLLAETQLERAQLDLSRTTIRAPFDGVVVEDPVEQNSFVSKGTPLVTLEDTSAAEVKTSLRMEEVARVWGNVSEHATASGNEVPNDATAHALPDVPAVVLFRIGSREFRWDGVLTRQEGRGLDARTRTLACRVLVPEPRNVTALDQYGQPLAELPPEAPRSLLRGMFVKVQVFVNSPLRLISLPADAVRPSGDVWLVRDGTLVIVRPNIVHASAGSVLLSAEESGIEPGDRVVTSQLANPYEGMAVRDASTATEAALPRPRRLTREDGSGA